MREPQFNQNQNIWEIDVPGDNSCLFRTVALAFLIPVKDNDYVFNTRFEKLFGKGSLRKLASVKNWIRSYNPFSMGVIDDTLGRLIRKQLHQRVVDHMGAPQNKDRFVPHIENSESDYLSRMKDVSTWGGESEIRAMSELLDCCIQVTEDEVDLPPYGVGTPIKLFHVGEPSPNHYRFGLEKNLGDNYQSAIKSGVTSEHKAASTSVNRLGTEEEPPNKKARYDLQARRAVVQEPQLKQPVTEKDFLKPPVGMNVYMSLISGPENTVQAKEINLIAVQHIHKAQQDPNTAYFSEVEKYSIDFKKDVIELRPFLEGQNQVLHLSFTGKDTLLGYITVGILFKKIKEETNRKVKKTVVEEQIYNYTKTNGIRVASLDWLLQKDEVLDDFKKTGENNLLVVECTAHPSQDKAEEKFIKLFSILDECHTKKAIFIAIEVEKQAGISSIIRDFFKKKQQYTEKSGNEIKFSDLTYESQCKVLKKEVVFQGQNMQLSQLMGVKDLKEELEKLNKVLDATALLELMTNTGIEIGSRPPGWHDLDTFFDEESYIPRSFNRRITYADKALTKNVSDLFAVGDIAEADFKKLIPENEALQPFDTHYPNIDPPKRFILLDGMTRNYQDQEETFNKLCSSLQEHHKDKVVHWLKKEKEELVWQRTWSQSQTYVYGAGALKEADTKSAPSDTTHVPDKIVVVIDEPGMGKSTTLTHVSEQALKAGKWAIRINLKDHQETIEKQLVQDDQTLLNLLIAIDTQGLKVTLARRILDYRLRQQEEIVLLLDGFDEISSNCQDKVLQLLQFVKNENRAEKVWITARLHTKTKLEDALSIYSYSFQPFNTADKQRFLKRFWTKRLIGEGQCLERTAHESCLAYYAGELIKKFTSPISTSLKTKTLGEVIGIPLLTRMLAEIFLNDLKDFYDNNKGKTEFALGRDSRLRILNLLELYQEFIKAKYAIYFKEKISIDSKIDPGTKQVLMDGIARVHQYLAFSILFPEQIESFLGERKDKFSNNELAAIGIIKDFKSHVPHFIHATFAEYFVADLLYMRLIKDKNNPTRYATVKGFLQEQWFDAKNDMIRLFLDYKLGLPVHIAVINGKGKEPGALLQENSTSAKQADLLGRIPLHLAAAYGYKTIIEQLINQAGSIDTADGLGEYPLSYAVLSGDEEVFRLILRKGRFPTNQTEVSRKILLATIQMVVQRWEKGMLEQVLSSAYVTRSQVAVMLEANKYATFGQAVQRSDYRMMKNLWAEADEKQQIGMWHSIDAVAAFQQAVKRGDHAGREMMENLWAKADEKQQKEMLAANNYAAFEQVIKRGDPWTMDILWDKADEKQQKEIWHTIDAEKILQKAVQRGDLRGRIMMESLLEKARITEQQEEMWASINAVAAFQQAVKKDEYEMMESLCAKADEKQKKEMWHSIDTVVAFQHAVQRNNYKGSEMMDRLWAKADEKQQKEMWTSIDPVAAFKLAVERGYYIGRKMMDSLWAKASSTEEQETMWHSIDAVTAFQQAVKKGVDEIMESLWAKADEKQHKEMLAANNYAAFKQSVQLGDHKGSKMMESLWEKASTTEQQNEMLAANNYAAFKQAVQMDYWECRKMIESLWKKASTTEQQKEMWASIDAVAAFQQAVKKGEDKMMDNLWEKASTTEQQKEMWTSIDAVAVFQQAVKKDEYEMMESLWAKADEKQQKVMWNSINAVEAFQKAVKKGDNASRKMMDNLWTKANEKQQKEMWNSIDAIAAFQQAFQMNSGVMDSLWVKASTREEQQIMWRSIDAVAEFQQAVKRCSFEGMAMMESLWEKADEKQQKEMLTANNYAAFGHAVQMGNYIGRKIMDSLWAKAVEKQQQVMWNSIDTVAAFQKAVKRGDYESRKMMDSLWTKADEKKQKEMWNNIDAIAAFQNAVQRGDLFVSNIMDSLWAKADEQQRKEMWNSIDAVAAFQNAVQRGNYDVSEMTDSLWAKADEKQQEEMWNSIDALTAFQKAVQRGDSRMMGSLWAKADEKQQKEMWNSIDTVAAFQKAVKRGDNESRKMMDNLWTKADEKQQKGMWNSIDTVAAFQKAVKRGDNESRKMMDNLWAKADENQQKEMWNSIDAVAAFQKAVQNDYYMMACVLFDKAMPEQRKVMWHNTDQAAFVHSRDKWFRNTPLHIAAELGYLALVRLLLENGANINISNYSNMTALHVAVRKGCLEIVKALLDHVKDPKTLKELISRPDKIGQTALQLATQHKHLETAKLIQETLFKLDIPFSAKQRAAIQAQLH